MPPPVLLRGTHSLAREGLRESQFRRRDRHCGTTSIKTIPTSICQISQNARPTFITIYLYCMYLHALLLLHVLVVGNCKKFYPHVFEKKLLDYILQMHVNTIFWNRFIRYIYTVLFFKVRLWFILLLLNSLVH